MENESFERPDPRWWPEPITVEQFRAYAPPKLELVDGYLLGGPEDDEARRKLLTLLLTNCGLETAVQLAHADHWREAMDRQGVGW